MGGGVMALSGVSVAVRVGARRVIAMCVGLLAAEYLLIAWSSLYGALSGYRPPYASFDWWFVATGNAWLLTVVLSLCIVDAGFVALICGLLSTATRRVKLSLAGALGLETATAAVLCQLQSTRLVSLSISVAWLATIAVYILALDGLPKPAATHEVERDRR